MLPEEDLSRLKEDQYYLFQIAGCSVVTEHGDRIGVVGDVLFIKDNDLLVIQRGKKEILVPFTNAICIAINLEAREIVIKPPEGLLDLNEI
jgi:16S rRNA processing protein RimM